MTGWLIDFVRDVQYGARVLRRAPGFALIAIVSLALGIGGASAVFTLVNAIILRSLPVPQPGELYVAERHQAHDVSSRFSWPAFEQSRDGLRGRAELAAWTTAAGMQLEPAGMRGTSPLRGAVQLVSGEYFDVLRQRPQLGRLLTPDDNRQVGGHAVAVISDGYWRRQFAGAPTVVGQTLAINGASFVVIGVTRPEFFGNVVALRSADVWIPLMMQSVVRYAGNASSQDTADQLKPWPPQADIEWLSALVRVPAAASPAAVESILTTLEHRDAEARFGQRDQDRLRSIQSERILLSSASHGISSLRRDVSSPLLVLLAMVGVLLVIACGNVAGLLIAKATAREREIAIRLSIGAGRAHLVRQLLTESLLLSLAGGLLGLAFAVWGRDLLLATFAPGATLIDLNAGLDAKVLAFALLVSLATGLLCGVLPAFRVTRVPLADSLKLQGRTVGIVGGRGLFVGRALVVAQMAFCLLLLVVAALFTKSLRTILSSNVGFDRERVVVARLDVRSLGYSDEQRQALYTRLIDRLSAIAGVGSVSLSANGPLGGSSTISSMSVEGHQEKRGEEVLTNEETVTERYFETVGLRIVQGRGFGPEDRTPQSRATVINETMARRFFPNGSAIGKHWSYETVGPDALVIVGVVEDARYVNVKRESPNMAYRPATARPEAILGDLEIRTVVAPSTLVANVRRTLAETEPRLPVVDALPLAVRIDRTVSQDRTGGRPDIRIRRPGAAAGVSRALRHHLVRHHPPRLGARAAAGAGRRAPQRAVDGDAGSNDAGPRRPPDRCPARVRGGSRGLVAALQRLPRRSSGVCRWHGAAGGRRRARRDSPCLPRVAHRAHDRAGSQLTHPTLTPHG